MKNEVGKISVCVICGLGEYREVWMWVSNGGALLPYKYILKLIHECTHVLAISPL